MDSVGFDRELAFPEGFSGSGNKFHLPLISGNIPGDQAQRSFCGGQAFLDAGKFSGAFNDIICRSFGILISIDKDLLPRAMQHRFPDQFVDEIVQRRPAV